MSLQKIFTNQTTDATVVADGVFDGLFQVEILGTLGSATMSTEIQSNLDPTKWIPLADGVWPSASGAAFNGNDAALMQIVNSVVRFVISGADESTDLSVSISSSSG